MEKKSLSYRLNVEIRYLEDFFATKKCVFLYGSGQEARNLFGILKLADLQPTGIIVSDGHRIEKSFCGVDVFEASDVDLDEKNDGIIIAIRNLTDRLEVMSYIREHWGGIQVYWKGTHPILPNARNCLPYFNEQKQSGPFFQAYEELDALGHAFGTDKASGQGDYLRKYEMFLHPWHNRSFTLLELGIFKGASLKMWGEYFPQAKVCGVDIDPSCQQYADGNREVIIADLGEEDVLVRLGELKPEIIIDDASHLWSHQVKALLSLWDALSHGGIYILEDIGTAFAHHAGEGYDDAILSGYDLCSALAEVVSSGDHLRMTDKPAGVVAFVREIERIGCEIDMISFINGSCLMVKR